jgi:hypothetical protein
MIERGVQILYDLGRKLRALYLFKNVCSKREFIADRFEIIPDLLKHLRSISDSLFR